MRDPACVQFLQWAVPRLGLHWPGFRRVRQQVCKRLGRRCKALGLADLDGYRRYLDSHVEEWRVLAGFCRISVTRFYRDRGVFDALRDRVLPWLANEAGGSGERLVTSWSAGCAAGEEPYTLAMVWRLAVAPRFPAVGLRIVASDADPHAIERAHEACYRPSSMKELPADWRATAFQPTGDLQCLRAEFRSMVELRCEDLRASMPDGLFDLILCRNLVFTYFAEPLRAEVARRIVARLSPCGVLVIGAHEDLDHAGLGLAPYPGCERAFRRASFGV